jgi:hypothetical protein
METIQPKVKKVKLTKKQKGFVKDFAIDENGTKAALNHYDIEGKQPEKIAAAIASENLTKPNIVDAIEQEKVNLKQSLLDEGINGKRIAEKINVLLNAEKKTFRNNVTTGEVEEVATETDYAAVDKGLKHATAIFGITPEGQTHQNNVTYNFLFSPETQNKIREINEVIKAKLINNEPNKQN